MTPINFWFPCVFDQYGCIGLSSELILYHRCIDFTHTYSRETRLVHSATGWFFKMLVDFCWNLIDFCWIRVDLGWFLLDSSGHSPAVEWPGREKGFRWIFVGCRRIFQDPGWCLLDFVSFLWFCRIWAGFWWIRAGFLAEVWCAGVDLPKTQTFVKPNETPKLLITTSERI